MSKKLSQRKCAKCGKKFTPKTANAAYCSPKCYKLAKQERRKAKRQCAKKVALKEKIVLPKKPTVVKPAVKKPADKKAKLIIEQVNDERLIVVGLKLIATAIESLVKKSGK